MLPAPKPVWRLSTAGRWLIGGAVIGLVVIAIIILIPTPFGFSW